MNNRINKAKTKQEKDLKNSIEKYNKLKSHLLNICVQIEKCLNNI